MGLPGRPGAHKDVVTTATHALDAFQELVNEELSPCRVLYDEQLTFESVIKAYLNRENFNEKDPADYPVFAYNRTPLRWPKGVAPSRRLNTINGVLNLGAGKGVTYRASQNEFDVQFMYLCRSVEDQERFEVAYQGERSISANRRMEVDMGDSLGKFNYFLTYSDLIGKQIIYDGAAYTAMIGQVTIRGLYFTFTGAAALINEVRLRIFVKLLPGDPAPDGPGVELIETITIP